MGDVVDFLKNRIDPKKKSKRKSLRSDEVQIIGFLTHDDRDLWIKNQDDIQKIISFIDKSGITIFENE